MSRCRLHVTHNIIRSKRIVYFLISTLTLVKPQLDGSLVKVANFESRGESSTPYRRGSRGGEMGEFSLPFFRAPFYFFSYPSNIEIIFDFSDIITKIPPPPPQF